METSSTRFSSRKCEGGGQVGVLLLHLHDDNEDDSDNSNDDDDGNDSDDGDISGNGCDNDDGDV